MYEKKLCLATGDDFIVNEKEQLVLFKKAGFDGFFTSWNRRKNIKALSDFAKELGLYFQSVHAPFGGCADLWEDDEEEVKKAMKDITDCIHDCSDSGVPIMVSHTYIGFDYTDTPNEKGLERYGKLIDEAEKYGIKIAFENTEGEEFLEALLKNFGGRKNVGFCLDTGHEMCYNRSKDLLAKYGENLIATHINDNLGITDSNGVITWRDDLHLLPFDGICDWDNFAKRIVKCGYNGPLTFELNKTSKPDRHDNDKYTFMPTEQYIAEVYARACKVAQAVLKYENT